jgi:ATP-dependent protease ClpP protease subunit
MSETFADLFSTKDRFINKSIGNISDYYLSGYLNKPEEYVEWFDHIRNAAPTDIIVLHINCFGGDLYTAIQFIRVMNECEGTIVASIEGACMSAATMIFLQADEVEISKHSAFMFHNYSGGTIGKGGEMIDQLTYERSWSENLLQDVYADFLTQKEIESMLNGKDLWMNSDEVLHRMQLKVKKINSKTSNRKSKSQNSINSTNIQ